MAQISRRNVHIHSSASGKEVAGFFQHGGVLISTVVSWINEVTRIYPQWALYPCEVDNNRVAGGPPLDSNSGDELQPGRYVIRKPVPDSGQISVFLTADVPRTRAYSINTPNETHFVDRVRERDHRCCISGNLIAGKDYTGFEVAHIFPLSETYIWNQMDYKRFITDDLILPGLEINSIQQGFLCSSTEHRMFDDYSIGINPDDNYRIYDFVGRDPNRSPHGRIFYRNLDVEPRYRPCDELLRDHFRQCVLQHFQGAGECDETQRRFDPDIDLGPGGFDLTSGRWWSGSEGKKQLEAELRGRLWSVIMERSTLGPSV